MIFPAEVDVCFLFPLYKYVNDVYYQFLLLTLYVNHVILFHRLFRQKVNMVDLLFLDTS